MASSLLAERLDKQCRPLPRLLWLHVRASWKDRKWESKSNPTEFNCLVTCRVFWKDERVCQV